VNGLICTDRKDRIIEEFSLQHCGLQVANEETHIEN
jgi:hypothetical protein